MGDIEARNGMLVRAPKPISEGISQKKKAEKLRYMDWNAGRNHKRFSKRNLGNKTRKNLEKYKNSTSKEIPGRIAKNPKKGNYKKYH